MKMIILLCLALAVNATAAEWMFTEPSSKQAPRLTIAADGTMITTYIVRNGRNANVMISTSSNNGGTWSAPSQIHTVLYSTIGLQRQPITVKAPNGTYHAIWENVRSGNQLAIYHTLSEDGGVTWTAPALVYDVSDGRSQDFSSIAVAPDGTLYVSFLSADIATLDQYQHVLVTKSADNGGTWQKPVRADTYTDGGACECCQQNIAVSPDGTVAVAYRSNISNRRDIFLSVSKDSGATFSTLTSLQTGTWTIDACPATGPSLVFDNNGMVHAAWRDTRDAVGRDVAYYARYIPFSRMLIQNVDISSAHASEAEYPNVAVSPNGEQVAIVFESSRGVQIARSNDGGVTFANEIVDAIAVRGVSPHVVWTSDNMPYAAWQSTRDVDFDVRVSNNQVTAVKEWTVAGETCDVSLGMVYDMLGRQTTLQDGQPCIVIRTQEDGSTQRQLILPVW